MMKQNTSPAVMQQRTEPRDSLDDFPTPPWATRALCEWLNAHSLNNTRYMNCREPSANRGSMVRPLAEYFQIVQASDIANYGAGFEIANYLDGYPIYPVDWTITNPPFRHAEAFIKRARTSSWGVAMFVRSTFTEGQGRYTRLFAKTPPSHIMHFAERVVLVKGRLLDPNQKYPHPKTGKMRKPSSATAYSWMIWQPSSLPTITGWIPPGTRARLERPDDYEPREERP